MHISGSVLYGSTGMKPKQYIRDIPKVNKRVNLWLLDLLI